MKRFVKHSDLAPHHRYQLEVIFVFTLGLILLLPYYLIIEEFRLDMNVFQWYFFWPWTLFYVMYSLNTRKKIKPEERINPIKRHIGYWVLLGLLIIFVHLQPSTLNRMQSLDLMFIILSLFLADSYWDFKQINIFRKKS